MLAIRIVLAAIALLLPVAVSAALATETHDASEVPASAPAAMDPVTLEAEVDFGATLERAELMAAVLARNPSLEAARQAHRAALERPAQARALMDPELTYGMAPLSVGGGSVPFGQSLEVEQMLPYPGKRRLRGEAAEAEADAAGLGVEALRLELALEVSRLFDDYLLVHRSLEVNAEHRRLMAGFMEIATARYAAGLLPQQAPIQAEVEIARLDRQRLAYDRERQNLLARLNRLLHRPPGAPLPPPPVGDALLIAQEAAIESWWARALAQRPELAAIEAEITALQAGADLARLARRPDFGVMGSYSSMYMDTEHQWMVGVSVNLPVRRERLRAAEAEADARVAAAKARRLALADAVRSDVREAWDRVAETLAVVELYASRLLPASRDQVQAALTAVETGRTSFLDLIEAERNLRSVELGYQEALADRNRRVAELQRVAGEMPGLPPGTAGLQPGSWAVGGAPPAESATDPASSQTGDSP